jgi:hypothetical protein
MMAATKDPYPGNGAVGTPSWYNDLNTGNPATQTHSNTGMYIGVPDLYVVQQGYYQSNTGHPSQRGNQPIFGVPHYTNSMVNALWGKGPEQVFNTQYMLYSLGYLPTFTPGTMSEKTQKAFEQAATDANRNGITFEQMLINRAKAMGAKGVAGLPGGSGGGGGGGSLARTITQTSVNLTSREGAMSVLANALASELGRQPSQAELTRFVTGLNKQERANPTVSTVTTDATGTEKSRTTKQGNVDSGYEATQFAKSAPLAAERNRFQDSQYFDVIAQMIGAK